MTTPAASTESATPTDAPLTCLVYSDRPAVREEVTLAIGTTIGPRNRPLNWVLAATPGAAEAEVKEGIDLIVADNETKKLGGVGLTRQFAQELPARPPVILLVAREQDAWLGEWSGAEKILTYPVDPFALRQVAEELLNV